MAPPGTVSGVSRAEEEYAAPRWLVQVLRLEEGPPPWAATARAAAGMGIPLLVVVAAGEAQLAMLASLGALPAVLADRAGPYRGRLVRAGAAVTAATAGYLVGETMAVTLGSGPAIWAAVAAVALTSALASAGGNTVSVAGLQWLIFTIIGSGLPLQGGQAWQSPLAFLAGGLWMLLLIAAGRLRRSYGPERRAVAAVYRALADFLASIGSGREEAARRRLTSALNAGYDAVVAVRSIASGRDPEAVQLVTLLSDVTPVIEAAVAVARERPRPLPASVPRSVAAMADAVLERSPGRRQRPEAPRVPRDTPATAALGAGLEAAAAAVAEPVRPADRDAGGGALETPAPAVPFRHAVRDVLAPGRRTWLFAARLTLCVAVAQVLRDVLPVERSYWIPLAVAIVLKPDFGPVVVRAFLIVAGNVLGVLAGAVLILTVPAGLPAAAVTVPVAAALPVALRRNFGLFSGLMSMLLLLLLEQVGQADLGAAVARFVDVLIGSAIVMAVGYLPWPTAWRVRIGPDFADATRQVVAYLRHSLTDPHHTDRPPLRRRTYRTLSDLRAAFQRALAEPPPQRTRVAAWWPAIIALERVVDAVTAAAIAVQRGSPAPSVEGVERLAHALEDAAVAARVGRPPVPYPAPEEELLNGVATEVRAVRTGLAGPPTAPRMNGPPVPA